jgi:deoxyribodipyrimidine photolyase-related protein
MKAAAPIRHLVVILGDQLNRDASAWDGFDAGRDLAWMCEASQEATHVPSSQVRIALFLSAMRHFAQGLRAEGVPLEYLQGHPGSLAEALRATLSARRVERVVLTEPGEWRVREALAQAAAEAGVVLEIREDRHFLCSRAEFERHAQGRKQLRMEYFYREMRQRHRVLMDGDEPVGGQWNFDADNRESFGREGPGLVPAPLRFEPDALTREVIADVRVRHGAHAGRLEAFAWPVTREQALQALQDFVTHRLRDFGRWQDAMWGGQPWLYHALVSSSLNLKLLDPREVVAAAEAAYRAGNVPLASAEGFIRQVLGWREYVNGVYWLRMPGYARLNELDAHAPVPAALDRGAPTDLACVAATADKVERLAWAHHIERLMIAGNLMLLVGTEPVAANRWFRERFADGYDWVMQANVTGMALHADGGMMATKPYAAGGAYLKRMTGHCRGCRFDPARRTGDDACPFTTLYWDFTARHLERLRSNPRTAQAARGWDRFDAAEQAAIRARADEVRRGVLEGTL